MTWSRSEPDSPCVQICMLHPETGYCVGCGRTGEEISRWPRMTPEDRESLLLVLPDRPKAPKGRRGGRQARVRPG